MFLRICHASAYRVYLGMAMSVQHSMEVTDEPYGYAVLHTNAYIYAYKTKEANHLIYTTDSL